MESGINGILAGLFLLYLLYALVLVVFYSVVMRFTTEFVTPTMLLTDRGVLDGWSRFWPTMKANWSDYGVYLLLVWILQFVVGIAASFVIGFAGVLLAIPFGIVIFLLVVAFDTVGLLLAVLLAIVGFVLFLVLASLLYVPIATYFRYYALLLLGDTDADLDLIPDRRGAVRGGGPVDGSDHGDGPVNGGDRGDGDGPSGFGAAESDSDRSSNRNDTGGWNDTSDWGDTGRQDDEADDTEYRDERDRPGDRDEDDDYGW
ncbi:hypothetical protein [Natrinema sp. SYSU A 869]|uniref:DUF7544 domain-containing protein n=1 Tax=Natrinema sp. SYSU A 869 TaxID=2871694 RepID=UPI002107B6A4|nr:hypothetical protein [Natrinema sp. SYSU A 869]